MNKKYIFTGVTKVVGPLVLHQIKRVSDGLIGGWIEREDNLSQLVDQAWVSDNACVSGHACVSGKARVLGNARVTKFCQCIHISNLQFDITITPQNAVIGCQIKTHKEWLKVTQRKAIEMELKKENVKLFKTLLPMLFKAVKQ